MNYRLLADLVLILHAGFVAFVVLGAVLALRWPRIAWVHVPVVLWGAGIEFLGGICPLTPLENHWRRLAGELGYPGGFVEHYVMSALYPDGLTRQVQLVLGALVLLVNVLIYTWVFRRRSCGRWCWPRGRRQPNPSDRVSTRR
jgi:Protein of Unknown function (DUF2784)